ncbi:hypothetical protein EQV77_10745 [Halobacillus fulvus]|nr:hypothetical protein EQV77_10745 [Halobacillus fulvus]
MSEKKKVIHVNDLVIKADNVIIEPQHHDRHKDHRRDRVDPFFGRRKGRESEESSSRRHHDDESSSSRRKGFSWF